MTDVTIPADVARAAAMILRLAAMKGAVSKGQDGTRYRAADLADLLDPPPSLRDECIKVVQSVIANYDDCAYERSAVDAVLAVVRRHVEALHHFPTPDHTGNGGVDFLARDDVLRLLGASDDVR